jgi:ribosomal protein S18 acetylase RimI-like enzyme
MKNCFIYHCPDLPERLPQVGIADLTNIGEMVPGTMTLTRINIPAHHRGQGHGSKFLKHICEEADKHGVALSLEIMPSGPLNYYALAEWYKRHGFRDADLDGIYIRRPRNNG